MTGTESSSTASCHCRNCPQNVKILLDGSTSTQFVDFLNYHAARYKEDNPHISISIQSTLDLRKKLLSAMDWDASIFPAQLMGSLVDLDMLWDLGPFLETSKTVDWTEILPFFRGSSAVYHEETESGENRAVTRVIPLDGDILSMYYRRDLFEQFNVTIPRTWEEYSKAAAFFHGKPLGPDGSTLFGSCVSRISQCGNEYWTSLILASMTQTMGTSSGFFLNPTTMRPLLGPAMEETLRITREQFLSGHKDELLGDCRQPNLAFNQGMCALTYNWGEQITASIGFVGDVGVAATPGSAKVLDRQTGKLVGCTESKCPHGIFYDDVGIINRPSYSAFGGWLAGVNSQSSDHQKYSVADFLAYVSNSRRSLSDVLPNERSTFAQPYRYTHTDLTNWIEAGFEQTLASYYTEAIYQVNSGNSVLELRVSAGDSMRDTVDDEVFEYLMVSVDPELTPDQDSILRLETTKRMEKRIKDIVRAGDLVSGVKLSDSYRRSIGHSYFTDQELNNYINESFRDAAWGLSGLMCVIAVSLMIWTFRHRNNRVMLAFQPFLLIQSCCGLLLMSSSIIPLGFDDSSYGTDILNITCMLAPWLYVVGFTLFFSSVYAKIKECIKTYRYPSKNDLLLVKPKSGLRLCVRLLILNGVILFLWTGLDPLQWERREVEGGIVLDDGSVETSGACRGGKMAAIFATIIYLLNMAEVLIASIQAFKCRFLVLEYNEMQWLPLSVFPFFEVWIIGGPILPLIQDDTTVTFVLLSMMIVVSTGVGGMAVFAPKDWYIRKFYHANPKQNHGFPARTSPAGIMVLQHPTVESQKQIEALSTKLGQIEGWNTELEIEIRMMKEKFKELSKSERFLLRENLMNETIKDTDRPTIRSSGLEEDLEQANSKSNDDNLVALQQFERVWKMTDDDDDDDETQLDTSPIPKLARSPVRPPAEAAPAYKRHLYHQQAQDSASDDSLIPPDDLLRQLKEVQEEFGNDSEADDSDLDQNESAPEANNDDFRSESFEDENVSQGDYDSESYNDRSDPLSPLAAMDDSEDEESNSIDASPHLRSAAPDQKDTAKRNLQSAPPALEDEELSEKDLIAQIIALRLAAMDAGDVNNDSVRTTPEDPLERLMKMSADDPVEASKNGRKAPTIALGSEQQEREKALIARIIALRLAAADREADNGDDDSSDRSSSPADPLERIMNMNAEDRLISAVKLKRYEDPTENEEEDDDEEDAIVHKKDFRDLSYMIQEDELDDLEREASRIAASVKAKLVDSNLADLTDETEATIDDNDASVGAYLVLAGGGNKDIINTSNVMGGLDISKISDDDDRRFVSMSDSILDSPGRGGHSNGFGQSLLGSDSVDNSMHSEQFRAGQSSGMDPSTRKGLSTAAAALLELDDVYATQFAGEPSQGENGKRGFGFHGNGGGKETIGHTPTRSPFTSGKMSVNVRGPDSSVQNNKSYTISDWSAVGGLANILADFSDSQSATSYTGSAYAESAYTESSAQDSEGSYDAPPRASASERALLAAEEGDRFVGTLDWNESKAAAASARYETSFSGSSPAVNRSLPQPLDDGGLSALEEKRRKKRELEAEADAWRESISNSLSK